MGDRLKFQSTLPIQGATIRKRLNRYLEKISIHAPNTGSDIPFICKLDDEKISIHAPNTGSDGLTPNIKEVNIKISIHAPNTGSDGFFGNICPTCGGISIHAPNTGSD